MRIRNILTLTCLLASFSLPACDEATEASELELAAADEAADREADADKLAAAPVDDEEDADLYDGELLGFSAAPTPSAYQCSVGEVQTQTSPTGTCGGCRISGSYPGQKFINKQRSCVNGWWGGWVNTGTSCDPC